MSGALPVPPAGTDVAQWLVSDGEWISTAVVAGQIGSDSASRNIADWAAAKNPDRPHLRTRAAMLEGWRPDGSLFDAQSGPALHWWFWEKQDVISDPLAGTFERRGKDGCLYRATGVQVSADDYQALCGASALSDEGLSRAAKHSPEYAEEPDRSPAHKAGRPPADELILAKADEMHSRPMKARDIAKLMRLEPGFENVATVHVRALLAGRYKSPGRPKKMSSK